MTKKKKEPKGKGMIDLGNRTGYFRLYPDGLWCFIPENKIDAYDRAYRKITDELFDFSKRHDRACMAFVKTFSKYKLSRSITSYKVFLIDKGK